VKLVMSGLAHEQLLKRGTVAGRERTGLHIMACGSGAGGRAGYLLRFLILIPDPDPWPLGGSFASHEVVAQAGQAAYYQQTT
jgi:hypothetical protein